MAFPLLIPLLVSGATTVARVMVTRMVPRVVVQGTKVIKPKSIPKPTPKPTSNTGTRVKTNRNKNNKCSCDDDKIKPSQKGNPVDSITGAKLLDGEIDTDFILNSVSPFVWKRSYSNQNTIETSKNPYTWYGQGWDYPFVAQIKVCTFQKKIEFILTMGHVVEIPYLEEGSTYYCLQDNLTLIREETGNEFPHSVYRFKIALGTLESANTFYEFYHQVDHKTSKPEYLILCTGTQDLYGNRIQFEYLHQDQAKRNYPSHIIDSINQVLSLEFVEINQQIRLAEIRHLKNINDIREHLPQHTTQLSLADILKLAEAEANRQFVNLEDVLNIKTLVRYGYSNEGDLVQVYTDHSPVEANQPSDYRLKLVRQFEWNSHIMVAHHIVDGLSSYYEYDEYTTQGKVIRHWISNGEEFLFQYHDGYTDVISAPNSAIEKIERFYFDEYDYLLQYIDGNGSSEFYEYNENQQLINKINAEGGITEYQYNGAELTKIRSLIRYDDITHLPIWREISLTWTEGRLTKVTDPSGNSETTAYDFAGQPLVITDALGHQTHIKYTPTGMAYQLTDAKGGQKRMLWDKFGNLQKYQDCSGKTTNYHYDRYGRLTAVQNALGLETRFKYYAHQQQPSEIHYPDGTIEQFKYDALERLIEYRDALGRTTTYQYSVDSLPTQRTDPANGTVTYHYDQLRRFVGLTNENGQTWTLEYDANDQVIAETTFDGVRTEYEYSAAGHLIKHRQLTENKEIRYSTVFKRDLLGQLLEQYIVDHHDLTEKKRTRYEYDLAGQLIQARNTESHVKLSYDAIGQLNKEQLIAHWFNEATQEHIQRTHTLTHLYDELGNRIETTLPDGRKLKTMYYGSGHAWHYALEDSEGIHEISSLKRDDLHQEIERTQGQLHSQFKLDRMGRLTEQRVAWEQDPSQKRLERLYDYDQAGQLKEIIDKRYLYSPTHTQQVNNLVGGSTASWQRKQSYQYDVLSRLTGSELSTQGQSENFIQIREQFAFDPASNILPIVSTAENKPSKILDNRVKHLEQAHQTVDYEYDDLGRVIQKRIHIKDKNAFGHIHQQLSGNHLLNQFTTRQIDLEWDEQNQLRSSTSTKPDGRGGQEIIQTQYCYDPFGRRIAKQSQTYKKEIITQQIQSKIQHEKADSQNSEHTVNHQLGSSMNLSLGGSTQLAGSSNLNINRSKIIRPAKTIQTESTQLVQRQAVWNVWDGNRILQDHNGKHVFTTVYEADSFIPLARLVWLDDQLTQAANDEAPSTASIEKLDQLKKIALQNIGELKGLDEGQTLSPAANDDQPIHSKHQIYWYQNDHLGTPRELTSNSGNIEWEAVYQAWGNTVTVEWQEKEVTQTTGLNPIQLNATEQSYLLQPHRFQGQIYDVETGLHYNRFRYYDPDTGRFISHDPIGLLGGDSHYIYAPNSINWLDPFGLKSCAVCGRDHTCSHAELETLTKAIDSAKVITGKIGKCTKGMSAYQLKTRKNSWLTLANARVKREKRCWKGGDSGHQEAIAQIYKVVGDCQKLLGLVK